MNLYEAADLPAPPGISPGRRYEVLQAFFSFGPVTRPSPKGQLPGTPSALGPAAAVNTENLGLGMKLPVLPKPPPPEPPVCPYPAVPQLVGTKYTVSKKAVRTPPGAVGLSDHAECAVQMILKRVQAIRKGPKRDSKKIGTIRLGQLVTVTDAFTVEGVLRVRVMYVPLDSNVAKSGWASIVSSSGDTLLAPVQQPATEQREQPASGSTADGLAASKRSAVEAAVDHGTAVGRKDQKTKDKRRKLLDKGAAAETVAGAVQAWPRALDSDEEEEEERAGQRGRGRDARESRCRSINQTKEDDSGTVEWVQCEAAGCGKWRLLPPSVKACDLPSRFECPMNFWNPEHSSCAAPEAAGACHDGQTNTSLPELTAHPYGDTGKPPYGSLKHAGPSDCARMAITNRMAVAKRKKEAGAGTTWSAMPGHVQTHAGDSGSIEPASKKARPVGAANSSSETADIDLSPESLGQVAMAESLAALATNRRGLDRLSLELLLKDEAALTKALKPLPLSRATVELLAGRGAGPPPVGRLSETLLFYDVDKIGRHLRRLLARPPGLLYAALVVEAEHTFKSEHNRRTAARAGDQYFKHARYGLAAECYAKACGGIGLEKLPGVKDIVVKLRLQGSCKVAGGWKDKQKAYEAKAGKAPRLPPHPTTPSIASIATAASKRAALQVAASPVFNSPLAQQLESPVPVAPVKSGALQETVPTDNHVESENGEDGIDWSQVDFTSLGC